MKLRLASFFLIMFSLTLLAVPARAQTDLYDNGPVNGQALGFTINFGQSVSDTFTLTANSSVNGMTFWAWMWPGTTIENVEIQFGSSAFGNDFFDQVVGVSPSSCFSNQYGFNVCEESASFNGVDLNAGTYWMTLSNAVTNNLDQAFWDVNSGEGCQGSGCPSQAAVSALGTVPSESFTILGNAGSTSTTGTTPEPTSLLLLASGALGVAGVLRRKLF